MFGGRWVVVAGIAIAGCVARPMPSPASPPAAEESAAPAASAASAAAPSASPSLTVTPSAVLLDGVKLDAPPSGRMSKLDALFSALKARTPQSSAVGVTEAYRLRVDAGSDGAQLKSALQTAALAGWPNAELELGDGTEVVQLKATLPMGRIALLFPPRALALIARRDRVELWRVPRDESDTAPPTSVAALENDNVEKGAGSLFALECKSANACQPGTLFIAKDADASVLASALSAWARALREDRSSSASRAEELWLSLQLSEPPELGQPLRVRLGAQQVSGRIAPVEIQRIVRAAYGRIRACYERGLTRDAKLTGKVEVRFVIARDGKVSQAELGPTTTLPDAETAACVAQVFSGLIFPQPEGGIVTVVYPLALSPD